MKDNHNAEIDAIDLRSEGPISLNPDNFTYTCRWRKNCNAELKMKEQLLNHVKYHVEAKHPQTDRDKIDIKILVHCQYCNKKLPGTEYITNHMKMFHDRNIDIEESTIRIPNWKENVKKNKTPFDNNKKNIHSEKGNLKISKRKTKNKKKSK